MFRIIGHIHWSYAEEISERKSIHFFYSSAKAGLKSNCVFLWQTQGYLFPSHEHDVFGLEPIYLSIYEDNLVHFRGQFPSQSTRHLNEKQTPNISFPFYIVNIILCLWLCKSFSSVFIWIKCKTTLVCLSLKIIYSQFSGKCPCQKTIHSTTYSLTSSE